MSQADMIEKKSGVACGEDLFPLRVQACPGGTAIDGPPVGLAAFLATVVYCLLNRGGMSSYAV